MSDDELEWSEGLDKVEREAAEADFDRFRLKHVQTTKLAVALATYNSPTDRELYLAMIFDRAQMKSQLEASLSVHSLIALAIELTGILDEVRESSFASARVIDALVRRKGLEAAASDE
jgi:hypothetical protein